MRVLIFLIAIVLLLAVVGWISFSTGPDRSSINIEKEEIKEDTRQLLNAGDEVLDRTRDSVDDSVVDEDEQERRAVETDLDASTTPSTDSDDVRY